MFLAEVYKMNYIDATCPLVTEIHDEIKEESKLLFLIPSSAISSYPNQSNEDKNSDAGHVSAQSEREARKLVKDLNLTPLEVRITNTKIIKHRDMIYYSYLKPNRNL